MAIRRSLMVSRALQLVGVVLMVLGIVACSQRDESRFMAQSILGGLVLIPWRPHLRVADEGIAGPPR